MAESEFFQAFVRLRSHTTGDWFAAPELRRKLVEDAVAQNSNLTEVAIEILCRHFKITYVPNGRKTNPKEDDSLILLRLPMNLYRALTTQYGTKYQDGIRQILSAHYGLRVPVRTKRQRARRSDTPAAA